MALPEKIQQQRNELVQQVIKDIQSGKPFFWDSGYISKRPRNLLKSLQGKDQYYNGINNIRLILAAKHFGFEDSRWTTFKQAQELVAKIQKGAKGIHIEYWQYAKPIMEINPNTKKKEQVYVIDEETGKKVPAYVKLDYPIVKNYVVFNASQVEGIKKEIPLKIHHEDTIKSMEDMIQHSEAKIYYDQDSKNYYSPSNDEIHVVSKERFKTLNNFYATVAHEIAHSTGAKNRLNRKTLIENDTIYAKEELRAELTSMFLAQKYNINFDKNHYENHVAYLQSWIKAFQDDPNELFRAASEAEKAMQYIETNMIGLKQEQTLSNNENKIDTNKLTIIKNFKPKQNGISTTQLYLKMAQNLLKEHDDIWQQDFNKKIVSELQNKGKNVFDIKQAIIKYSPVNMPTEELKNITKLSQNKSLSR
ncbi:ArdC family protein [uncultured Megamonas sp.]|uniref:ArdC family protein n=1 Tax=uncultured Megamonas sp. TaxID=286140 RepID=UPI0025958D23|nr:zincin-like metallopeptidase domain-containing protein [uncultured Megamonas sp.]